METDIKKYFNFEWNATRTNFWMFNLLAFVIFFIIGVGQGASIGSALSFWVITEIVLTLAFLIPNIAINKARCNDAGWSGWWMICPIMNIVVMGFFPTKIEDNKYLKQKGRSMSLVSILDKIESKILELEDKKDEIQQQIRDMSALDYFIQDKINEVAEDIAETRRNMIMEGVADIEGLLMEAGCSEEEAMDVDENMEVTEAIQEAEWNY